MQLDLSISLALFNPLNLGTPALLGMNKYLHNLLLLIHDQITQNIRYDQKNLGIFYCKQLAVSNYLKNSRLFAKIFMQSVPTYF